MNSFKLFTQSITKHEIQITHLMKRPSVTETNRFHKHVLYCQTETLRLDARFCKTCIVIFYTFPINREFIEKPVTLAQSCSSSLLRVSVTFLHLFESTKHRKILPGIPLQISPGLLFCYKVDYYLYLLVGLSRWLRYATRLSFSRHEILLFSHVVARDSRNPCEISLFNHVSHNQLEPVLMPPSWLRPPSWSTSQKPVIPILVYHEILAAIFISRKLHFFSWSFVIFLFRGYFSTVSSDILSPGILFVLSSSVS